MHSIKVSLLGVVFLASSLSITGCSSRPVKPSKYDIEIPPDRVVSRSDEMIQRPNWLRESTPFAIVDGLVISMGETEIPGDHRLDAAYRIAQNNAAAGMSSAIERKLEFMFQNAEEGTSIDARQARFIGAEVSRLVSNSLRPGKRYWEKVVHFSDYGARETKYRVFATVEMPESDFKKAIVDALRRREGKAGLSAEFTDKVNEEWNRIMAPEPLPAQALAAGPAPSKLATPVPIPAPEPALEPAVESESTPQTTPLSTNEEND